MKRKVSTAIEAEESIQGRVSMRKYLDEAKKSKHWLYPRPDLRGVTIVPVCTYPKRIQIGERIYKIMLMRTAALVMANIPEIKLSDSQKDDIKNTVGEMTDEIIKLIQNNYRRRRK